jgi:hypothetical protein
MHPFSLFADVGDGTDAARGEELVGQTMAFLGLACAALGFLFSLLPGFIALARKHPNATAIFLLSLFFGWTVVGWVVALVWAFTNPPGRQTIVIKTGRPALRRRRRLARNRRPDRLTHPLTPHRPTDRRDLLPQPRPGDLLLRPPLELDLQVVQLDRVRVLGVTPPDFGRDAHHVRRLLVHDVQLQLQPRLPREKTTMRQVAGVPSHQLVQLLP